MSVDHASVLVDLDAVRHNVGVLCRRAAPAAVMAVVKADGYGHGMVPVARAALDAGASWLGVAFLDEACALRAAGIRAPVLAWLLAPGEAVRAAIDAEIDLGVYAETGLAQVAAAARAAGRPARIHLKIDTGLGRGGATVDDWPGLVGAAAREQAAGRVRVVGIWSHLAHADAPDHPTITRQVAAFEAAVEQAGRVGIHPELRHLANSAATLRRTDAHFDLVRPGVAVYGLSPGPAVGTPAELGLRPAMTLRATVAVTKRVPAGTGVAYGHRYVTDRETTLAIAPLGYADGVPRQASNIGELLVGGRRRRIAGTVSMDQIVVDVGDDPVRPGDEAVLFGPGGAGEPTADEWAAAVGTINYEIVTRIGPRVPRRYRGAHR